MDAWVIQVLREGYSIPWVSDPPVTSSPPLSSTYRPGSFKARLLVSVVSSLLRKGASERVSPPRVGFYSVPFLVTETGVRGGWFSIFHP